jgi:hypothetical protein
LKLWVCATCHITEWAPGLRGKYVLRRRAEVLRENKEAMEERKRLELEVSASLRALPHWHGLMQEGPAATA